jgi:hypothetical protein
MSDPPPPLPHPGDEEVAAYLEGTLASAERTPLETHLANCEYCRARLVLAGGALGSAPRPRSQTRALWGVLTGLAAAAAVAGVVLVWRPTTRTERPAEVRAPEQEATGPQLRVVAPVGGATVPTAELRFTWLGLGSDVLYQVTLSAADGRTLWSTRTSDTTASPPPETLRELVAGQHYFWRVDALFPSLRSVTSGDRRFEISNQ